MKIEEVFCNTFKAIRKTISPDVRKSVDLSIPSMPMVEACRADDFDFFAPFIAAGDLTVRQMQHACQRYYLGKTKSGQPIFWMIDDMLTPLDAHIGSTAWMSILLKAREPLIASWQVTHCLFGLHLISPPKLGGARGGLRSAEGRLLPEGRKNKRIIAMVESEISAVLLSELLPEYVWMAYATTAHLSPELFAPLQGHKVILFPRTDPTLSTYLFFKDLAALVRQHYGLDITVSRFLEDRASPEQKDRCIDLVDFLFL